MLHDFTEHKYIRGCFCWEHTHKGTALMSTGDNENMHPNILVSQFYIMILKHPSRIRVESSSLAIQSYALYTSLALPNIPLQSYALPTDTSRTNITDISHEEQAQILDCKYSSVCSTLQNTYPFKILSILTT
jgi:hypothetical protein